MWQHFLLLLLVLVACETSSLSSQWIEAYELQAHRHAFEALGLTGSDLGSIDAADAAALKARMKRYEALRFDRAIADARRHGRPPTSAAMFAPAAFQRNSEGGGRVLSEALSLSEAMSISEDKSLTRAEGATQLKQYLLQGRNGTSLGYDKTIAPSSADGGPVDVSLGIDVYHVFGLDLKRATMALQLWVRMSWSDSRLAWNPAEWAGVQSLTFVASPVAIEESQIWVPEIELYQSQTSTYALSQKEVIVYANGTTYWSRPGEVTSMCGLSGLSNFPFDRVMCTMRFGGWSLPGSIQNVTAFGARAIDDTISQTAMYQEYKVVDTRVTRGVGKFSCCPDPLGWPYVEFGIELQRAEKQYNIKIIMLNIVLTYLSFAVFLLDPKTGERLQFSTTVLLTIVAADSLVTGVVPVCRPVLWIEWFFLVCWIFCIVSIIGNMLVHWLYYRSLPEVYASGMPRITHRCYAVAERCYGRRRGRGDGGVDAYAYGTSGGAALTDEAAAAAAGGGGGSAVISGLVTSSPARGGANGGAHALTSHPRRLNSLSPAASSRALVLTRATSGGSLDRRGGLERRGSLTRSATRGDGLRAAMLRRQHTNPILEPNAPHQHGHRIRQQHRHASVKSICSSASPTTTPKPTPNPTPQASCADLPAAAEAAKAEGGTKDRTVAMEEEEEEGKGSGGAVGDTEDGTYGGGPKRLGVTFVDPLGGARDALLGGSSPRVAPAHAHAPSAEAGAGGGREGARERAPPPSDAPSDPEATFRSVGLTALVARRLFGRSFRGDGLRPQTTARTGLRRYISSVFAPRGSVLDLATADASLSSASTPHDASLSNSRRHRRGSQRLNSVLPMEGAFVDAEELAQQVTATELDPVQAALVRKAFRLLDSMSALMGVLGPEQMQYFAHHMGKLPTGLLLRADDNEDGLWSIEEFSQLCVELIKMHGNDKFRILVEGLLESYAHKRQLHEVYWHGWALWLDYVMGISLTTLYSLALAVLFSFMGRLEEELPDMGTLPLT